MGIEHILAICKQAARCCLWPVYTFPANKKENRGAPALCVSGNFLGKQRVFGAPFWKLASFPESESWSGAKSEAKLRKSARYPGGRRDQGIFRYTGGFLGIPAKNTRYFADLADFGPAPNEPQTRVSAQSPENLMVSPGKERGKERVL